MDKIIFYTMVISMVGFGYFMYHGSQAEILPAWSKSYQEPPRAPLASLLRQQETWLFVIALMLAVTITSL